VEPQTARELGQRKAAHVVRSGAEMVVTGNPGCLLQISKELREQGREVPVRHFIELLDASISGDGLGH
jgi:glycolate oxidase iron-sulfur subunit